MCLKETLLIKEQERGVKQAMSEKGDNILLNQMLKENEETTEINRIEKVIKRHFRDKGYSKNERRRSLKVFIGEFVHLNYIPLEVYKEIEQAINEGIFEGYQSNYENVILKYKVEQMKKYV